ncbi:hypothetical protein L1987_56950 [Smallanthus sonchifolius]|uniref:Uncharacterized protein n=1 Tax=Smallanthus sonchifolius TaxID=185202 RepID=A0ACB9DBX7_9ASTR|nr:hypothetical protein L1987_56950 [Smallanthus sonchifolius]
MSCQYRTTPPPPNQLHPLLQPPTSAAVRIDEMLEIEFTLILGVNLKKNFIVTISSDKGLCGGINFTYGSSQDQLWSRH